MQHAGSDPIDTARIALADPLDSAELPSLQCAPPTNPSPLFGALGAALAWILAVAVDEIPARLALSLGTGVLLAVVAGGRSRRGVSPIPRWTAAVLLATVAASVAGTLLVGRTTLFFDYAGSSIPAVLVGDGLMTGLLRAIGMCVAAIPVFVLLRTAGRSRAGSLCDGADRRAPWGMALAVVALMAAGTWLYLRLATCTWVSTGLSVPYFDAPICGPTHFPRLRVEVFTPWLGAASTVGLFVLLALDERALRRCRRLARTLGEPTWSEPAATEVRDPAFVDLGIGEQRYLEPGDDGPDPYRSPRGLRATAAGDPDLAGPVLEGAVLRNLLLALLAMSATMIALMQ